MNKLLIGTIAGAAVVLVIGVAAAVSSVRKNEGSVFIATNGPVSEDQVRQKLASEGWSNIQIAIDGQYLEVVASKDQKARHFAVDSQTGRLRGGDDDD